MNRFVILGVACLGAWQSAAPAARAEDDFDRPPIEYSTRSPDNRVSQLIAELESGEKSLRREPKLGYLRSLLEALEVPISSQTLVFSKTSLQRSRITARTPRALYFSDDLYVGFCQDGEVLEISAVDDALGTVFYTLDQSETDGSPSILRQSDNCLICHASSTTLGVPGHVVRSVFADASGMPLLSSGSFRTDQSSPLAERWGGWYVTGTHGPQKHLGNMIARGREPERDDNAAGQNVTDISDRFNTRAYLTPHSDIVALMVLEHQTAAHNHITHANFATRQALHYQDSLNRELGEPADKRWPSTDSRIRSACEPLIEYLFYCDEAPLTHQIQGTSPFAEEFVEFGPRDQRGRSLRDFDLERRMFRYPLSYLVYSSSFQALPGEARDYVYRRMREILDGADASGKFRHLSADDRRAIREILADTLPDFPAS